MIKLPFIFLLTFYVSQSFGQNQVHNDSLASKPVNNHYLEIEFGGLNTVGISLNYTFQKKWTSRYLGGSLGIGLRQGTYSKVSLASASIEGGILLNSRNSLGMMIGISSLYDPNGHGISKEDRNNHYENPGGANTPYRPILEKVIGAGLIYRYQMKKFGIGLNVLVIQSYFSGLENVHYPFVGISFSLKLNKNPNLLR